MHLKKKKFKRWNRKEGRGNKTFNKGGKLGQGVGALKRGAGCLKKGRLEPPYKLWLRSIYFAIFGYLSYCCLVWAQNCSTIQHTVALQKKAVRIINFQPRNSHTNHLFKQSSILNFQDKICLENILFVTKSLNNLSPSVLIHDLVFPQISISMKPQVLHRVTSWNVFIKQIDVGSIQ